MAKCVLYMLITTFVAQYLHRLIFTAVPNYTNYTSASLSQQHQPKEFVIYLSIIFQFSAGHRAPLKPLFTH